MSEEQQAQETQEPLETQETAAPAAAEATETQTPFEAEDVATKEARKRANEAAYQRRKLEQIERENAEMRQRLEALAQKAEPRPEGTARPQRPTEDQFDYDAGKYQQALAQYEDQLVDWKLAQRETQLKAAQKHNEQARRVKEFETTRETVVTKGSEKYADFSDVVFSLPGDVMTEQVAAAVFETDTPEDVAYYLGRNPDEAAQIARLSPVKMAVALGKIDAKLSAAATRKTTAAPPPPGRVDGSRSAPMDRVRLARDNPKEFARLRNEGKI